MEGDKKHEGRSSPFATFFSGARDTITRTMSPIGDRKEGQDKPPKFGSAPGFADVKKPSTVVATSTKDALDKVQSAEVKPTGGQGGEPEKKGFLGLWGGRRRRKSRRRKTKRRKKKRKSRRRKKTKRRKKKRKSRRRKSRRRKR
tara:strand:- start:551 stop:982 length:432 start_codon:yes stop_codon:yes gene_type:complete